MRPPDITQSPSQAPSSIGTGVLGRDHPLVRVTETLHAAFTQWCTVLAIGIGGGIAYLDGSPWARAVTLAAGAALLVLTISLASLRARRRDCAIDLILEDREDLPIAAVQRERERLRSARTRRALARRFEEMINLVTHPYRVQLPNARPLYHVRVVAQATPELRQIARLLAAGGGRSRA
jgi:hypothetical protein